MKKLGFGCMRLPLKDGVVDYEELNKMVDVFMAEGFNYFDTAHGYVNGLSEIALRECLTKRYPRESYVLVDKLTTFYFNSEEEIMPLFQKQLENTGVEYFDYYLMHALNAEYYDKYLKCNAFEIGRELKKSGKIKHLGISFHDKAEVLDKILTEQPDIELVQIQFNYADFEDPGIESRKCYEVCVKHNKPVVAMEPVKGGALANLPENASEVLKPFKKDEHTSNASFAVRFCASFENMFMVISGMSNLAQMEDNISYMKSFVPFSEDEYTAVKQVCEVLKSQGTIACTACQYCVEECPKLIPIPDTFACYNAKKQFNDWNSDWYYGVYTKEKGKAKDCIQCGKCEKACPQHLPIRELLKEVSGIFDQAQ